MTNAFAWSALEVAVRSALVLVFLTVAVRLLGKRQLGQLRVYGLAMILLIANAVQNAMTVGKGELSVGLASAGALLLVGRLAGSLFARRQRGERSVAGTPTLLVSQGHVIERSLRRERVTQEMLMQALREHGLADPGQARLVVLEPDGSLSVVPHDPAPSEP